MINNFFSELKITNREIERNPRFPIEAPPPLVPFHERGKKRKFQTIIKPGPSNRRSESIHVPYIYIYKYEKKEIKGTRS